MPQLQDFTDPSAKTPLLSEAQRSNPANPANPVWAFLVAGFTSLLVWLRSLLHSEKLWRVAGEADTAMAMTGQGIFGGLLFDRRLFKSLQPEWRGPLFGVSTYTAYKGKKQIVWYFGEGSWAAMKDRDWARDLKPWVWSKSEWVNGVATIAASLTFAALSGIAFAGYHDPANGYDIPGIADLLDEYGVDFLSYIAVMCRSVPNQIAWSIFPLLTNIRSFPGIHRFGLSSMKKHFARFVEHDEHAAARALIADRVEAVRCHLQRVYRDPLQGVSAYMVELQQFLKDGLQLPEKPAALADADYLDIEKILAFYVKHFEDLRAEGVIPSAFEGNKALSYKIMSNFVPILGVAWVCYGFRNFDDMGKIAAAYWHNVLGKVMAPYEETAIIWGASTLISMCLMASTLFGTMQRHVDVIFGKNKRLNPLDDVSRSVFDDVLHKWLACCIPTIFKTKTELSVSLLIKIRATVICLIGGSPNVYQGIGAGEDDLLSLLSNGTAPATLEIAGFQALAERDEVEKLSVEQQMAYWADKAFAQLRDGGAYSLYNPVRSDSDSASDVEASVQQSEEREVVHTKAEWTRLFFKDLKPVSVRQVPLTDEEFSERRPQVDGTKLVEGSVPREEVPPPMQPACVLL